MIIKRDFQWSDGVPFSLTYDSDNLSQTLRVNSVENDGARQTVRVADVVLSISGGKEAVVHLRQAKKAEVSLSFLINGESSFTVDTDLGLKRIPLSATATLTSYLGTDGSPSVQEFVMDSLDGDFTIDYSNDFGGLLSIDSDSRGVFAIVDQNVDGLSDSATLTCTFNRSSVGSATDSARLILGSNAYEVVGITLLCSSSQNGSYGASASIPSTGGLLYLKYLFNVRYSDGSMGTKDVVVGSSDLNGSELETSWGDRYTYNLSSNPDVSSWGALPVPEDLSLVDGEVTWSYGGSSDSVTVSRAEVATVVRKYLVITATPSVFGASGGSGSYVVTGHSVYSDGSDVSDGNFTATSTVTSDSSRVSITGSGRFSVQSTTSTEDFTFTLTASKAGYESGTVQLSQGGEVPDVYEAPVLSGFSYAIAPASGGVVPLTVGVITQRVKRGGSDVWETVSGITWASVDKSFSVLSGVASVVDDGSLSWGVNDTSEERKAVVRLRVTVNGMTTDLDINALQAIPAIGYGTPYGLELFVDDIPASGGSCSEARLGGTVYVPYTQGSDSRILEFSVSDISVSWGSAVSASSLGTTLSDRSRVGVLSCTYSIPSLPAAGSGMASVDVYQEANVAEYTKPVVMLSYDEIPARGGSVAPMVSYSQEVSYSSGVSNTITVGGDVSFSGTLKNTGTDIDESSGLVTARSMGTTSWPSGAVVASVTVDVVLHGKSGTASVDVRQEANVAGSITYGGISITEFSYEDVRGDGGNVYPTLRFTQARGREYTSEEMEVMSQVSASYIGGSWSGLGDLSTPSLSFSAGSATGFGGVGSSNGRVTWNENPTIYTRSTSVSVVLTSAGKVAEDDTTTTQLSLATQFEVSWIVNPSTFPGGDGTAVRGVVYSNSTILDFVGSGVSIPVNFGNLEFDLLGSLTERSGSLGYFTPSNPTYAVSTCRVSASQFGLEYFDSAGNPCEEQPYNVTIRMYIRAMADSDYSIEVRGANPHGGSLSNESFAVSPPVSFREIYEITLYLEFD